MTVDFKALKKNSSMDKLKQEVEKLDGSKGGGDGRFWKVERDKVGNGSAVIRFLPPPQGEDVPWARVFNHAFKGPTGKWYIENSLTTIGKADPVSEANAKLWATGTPENQDLVRKRKRKLNYITNIYVVSDPTHPENEGKVFLFKFGKKIFDKIKQVMQPEFADETEINPFDLWAGANFRLKVRTVDEYPNYELSSFANPGPLLKDDAELEKIWKQEYSLAEFTAPSNFKSYEELKKRLDEVLGDSVGDDTPVETSKPRDVEKRVSRAATPVADIESEIQGSTVDNVSYFANLAKEMDDDND